MNKRKTERYPVEWSGFYRLGTQRSLAKLLNLDLRDLKKLASEREMHYWFKQEVINGKTREIQCPIGSLRQLHERLKALFNRIDRPDFLHAPRHGSSYVTNAQVHANSVIIATLDIRRFYPSTTSEHVFQYLYHRLGMAADVAGILTKVCTIEGRLPFGSPLSPILCFQVHRHMFASIEEMCRANGLAMTLYVDDIAISGKSVPLQLIYEVKKLIHNVGLQYHKVRRSSRTRKPVITGVQITEQGIAPANKSHLRMKEKLAELNATTVPEARLKIVDSLVGLNQHMLQTYSDTNAAHERLHRQKSWLHNERRRLQRLLLRTRVIGGLNRSPTEDDELSAPF